MVLVLALLTVLAAVLEVATRVLALALTTGSAILHGHGPAVADTKVPAFLDARLVARASLAAATGIEVLAVGQAVAKGRATVTGQATRGPMTTGLVVRVTWARRPAGKEPSMVRALRTLADALGPGRDVPSSVSVVPTVGATKEEPCTVADYRFRKAK